MQGEQYINFYHCRKSTGQCVINQHKWAYFNGTYYNETETTFLITD